MVTRKPGAARRTTPQRIYQLLVRLADIEPAIWRRLWVPDTLTLAKLDRVIQAAMGWTNSHLHAFHIQGRRYGMRNEEWGLDGDLLEDKKFQLADVLDSEVQQFEYVYDFGDDWMHQVMIEKVLQPQQDVNMWPMCVAGANACPPEDVGGTPGYMDFLHAMRDPQHEEHGAMWLWWGGPFDPNGFDLNAANQAIRRLR